MTILRPALGAFALLGSAHPALAQSQPLAESEPLAAEGGLDLSANVGMVSDYRYRGVSLSDRGPALQGGADLVGKHFFVGTWASSIAEYGGTNVEIDVYGGLQGGSDRFGWTAGAYAYLYPGGEDVNYVEAIASAETYIGPVTLGLEAAHAPRQDNVDVANTYLGASGSFDAGSGFGVRVRGGYEDGFYDGKWDWEVGASYTRGPLAASLSYVDTDHGGPDQEGRLAAGGIVASLLATF